MILFLLFVLFLVPSAASAVYLNALAIARFAGLKQSVRPGDRVTRFVIVIPAHNEQEVIPETLRSIKKIEYPVDRFEVVVVADNCTDDTVKVSEQAGFSCWERTSSHQLGKGHALAWAFSRLPDAIDVVVVVDADCAVDPKLLAILDGFYQRGAKAVQANHSVGNIDTNAITYAAAVGRALEYDLFFAPKTALGLTALLVGTGMSIHRSVLTEIPWDAHSCAEDTEYSLELARHRVRIEFAADTFIECRAAATNEELEVQRTRWASGNLQLGKTHALRQLVSALINRNLVLFDCSLSLLITSRPLLLLHAAVTVIVSWLVAFTLPSPMHTMAWHTACLTVLAYGLWISFGIVWIGLSRRRIMLLLRTPLVLTKLTWIALRSLFSHADGLWRRTPRYTS